MPRTCAPVEAELDAKGKRICWKVETGTKSDTDYLAEVLTWGVAIDAACVKPRARRALVKP